MPTTLDQLSGYVERDLDADLARWFADEPRAHVEPTVQPVEPFLAKLPPTARTALAGLDRRVRAGTLPMLAGLDIDELSYGFDFAANDVTIFDENYENSIVDDVWTLGMDGGGNYYVVLASGRVAVWNHELDAIEGHTQFADLDLFLWSMVRLAAVTDGVLSRKDIAADFATLAQPGALFLLERLD